MILTYQMMYRYILAFLLIISSFSLMSQQLSQAEAYQFADKLLEVEILSQKGHQELTQRIRANQFERFTKPRLADGGFESQTELAVSHLLLFLMQAFEIDLNYRIGGFEQNKALERTLDEHGGELTQEVMEQFQAYQVPADFIGYQIEDAIQDEEDLPAEARQITIYPAFSSSRGGMPRLKQYDLIHHNRSVLSKTRTRTLRDLLEIGLIDQQVFEDVFQELNTYPLILEYQVLAYTAERAIFYEDFSQNKADEKAFIKSLNQKGIISNKNAKKLLSNENKDVLLTKFDMLRYSNDARIFQVADYGIDPVIAYQQIFEAIKTIVPDFSFTNFQAKIFEVKEQYDPALTEYRAKISFEVGEQSYENEFFYDFVRKDSPEVQESIPIHNDFHQGVNKYLADIQSDYRLYFASKLEANRTIDEEEFGLTLLTEAEYQAWGESSYFLYEQSHQNTFTSQRVEQIITDYQQIGLFDHLSPTEIEAGKACVRASTEINSYQNILLCFPHCIVYFDWETGNLENPYEELTIELGKASRGAFTPSKIIDSFQENWENKQTHFSFTYNGKVYQRALKMNSDWLDPEFMSLIEEAILEQGAAGRFHYCIDDGQMSGHIFLTEEQYAFILEKQEGFFPEWE